MEISINEKKYLNKIIKKYPKKKIYKLIKKKDNIEISNDLKSLLTKMENVNFMDNYYDDMIGGTNFFNSANNLIKGQNAAATVGPNALAQAGKQTGFQMQNFKNPFNRPQGAAGPVAAPAAGIANAIGNLGDNFTKSFQNMTGSLNQIATFLKNPQLLQNFIDLAKSKVNDFIGKIQNKIGNLSPNLSYSNNLVSGAVETYLLALGIPAPLNRVFGRFYFAFFLKPYIQTILANNMRTYPIYYNEQNFIESPISDGYDYEDNTPNMFYPINYNPMEKYPMEGYPMEEYPMEEYPMDEYPMEEYPMDEYPMDEYPMDNYN